MSENLTFEIGEEAVYCPGMDYTVGWGRRAPKRGADGEIIDRETSKKKQKDGTYRISVKSVLIKFTKHRGGVACFRRRGKPRPKSNSGSRFFQNSFKKRHKTKDNVYREEEAMKHLHPLSYCYDCPLRMHRLVRSCNMSKEEAINLHGKDKD